PCRPALGCGCRGTPASTSPPISIRTRESSAIGYGAPLPPHRPPRYPTFHHSQRQNDHFSGMLTASSHVNAGVLSGALRGTSPRQWHRNGTETAPTPPPSQSLHSRKRRRTPLGGARWGIGRTWTNLDEHCEPT